MEVLLWSYQRMDVQLQRCFLFFGSFIRGTWFTKCNLVQYWVALDFIQPSDDQISVQDVGFGYFDLMLANSMIVERVHGYYTIHDLFHELAENLSAGDCFRVTDSEMVIPSNTVLHASLRVSNENLKEKLSSISNLHNLRTFFLETQFIEDVKETLFTISTTFKHLRVLEIWTIGCSALPEIVGDLRNLRYLDVYRSSIKELPDSVSKLYHIQYLLLPECVKTLPATLRNLTKLRSIGMYDKKDIHNVTDFPPVPYLGRLTSLQNLPQFHVRREEGYELQQLGHLREIVGTLGIVGLENVRDKDEALAAKLNDKHKLTSLVLVWTGSGESIASEVDVIEALQPPTNLKLLTIDGYGGSVCPTWLQEGSNIPYLQSIGFYNCNALEVLPLNFSQFRHCKELVLSNLGALRELPAIPDNLVKPNITRSPYLALLCKNEVPLQVDFQGIEAIGFSLLTDYPWKVILEIEVKGFERTGSVENCQEQLQIIKSYINRDNIPSEKWEDVVGRAWWPCHQQRVSFISGGTARANKLELPLRLCILNLSCCCISDGALSDCLRGMASLQKLTLCGIMTITTLPPAGVLQNLKSLQDLNIIHCWCLRSLSGLHSLPHLQKVHVEGCWNLEMKNDACALLLPTLHTVIIRSSIISENIFHANLPCLQNVEIFNCHVLNSLSFCHLNSLQTLKLFFCPSLHSIKLCPIIGKLGLIELPNLDAQSVLESWRGCQRLEISNSVMLNKLLLSRNFVAPKVLVLNKCQEEAISFEKSVHLQTIKTLWFYKCKTKNLPTSLSNFSSLEFLNFDNCLEILELPELPSSVQSISIINCPVLKERCQPNGPDWHKVQHIKSKRFE